ncbi:MAG: RsmB/NOP family class I SAM-dependent RNA methyltransferase [Pseudomonadota bacterium]|nr:RsmB/NOP family class I SAM-dependent RNA methyltransferase [Pseudomonadota bacterium]
MTPGARIAAAGELLDAIDASRQPAERLIRDWFRTRRYAGSGDRRAIGERVFRVLRRRAELDWRLNSEKLLSDNKLRSILDAMIENGETAVLAGLDGPHGPGMPDSATLSGLRAAVARDPGAAPDPVRGNYPDFLDPAFRAVFGSRLAAETAALSDDMAAVDLRVNLGRTSRGAVIARLAADGIAAAPFGWSPATLRLEGRPRIDAHPVILDGLAEVQDAASQLVALLLDAQPGERVADTCAGAGGKTLALAMAMQGQGTIHALDVDGRRLQRLVERAARAETTIVRTATIDPSGPFPDILQGRMDRVLVDAPCSGTGTWRRQPELRWRLSPEEVAHFHDRQVDILDRAAALLRPGGRLVYATCSLLPDENETVVTDLRARRPDLAPLDAAALLAEAGVSGGEGLVTPAGHLRLTPFSHGTDGFFAAAFEAPLR